ELIWMKLWVDYFINISFLLIGSAMWLNSIDYIIRAQIYIYIYIYILKEKWPYRMRSEIESWRKVIC
ncbi:MAG: hypothetical protein N7Q72_04310, partial [Spiroplasma sp. Tabriz.8]|nr:hypothetical protein [Spiroplasma sp. Tabriz.8]